MIKAIKGVGITGRPFLRLFLRIQRKIILVPLERVNAGNIIVHAAKADNMGCGYVRPIVYDKKTSSVAYSAALA